MKSRVRQMLNKLGFIVSIIHLALAYQQYVDDSGRILWNAALCKPAYQIDVYPNGAPDKAVDGNRNPYFNNGSCFHTASIENTWWMVDLMDEYLVHEVVITNRADRQYGNRFRSVFVDLFLSDPRPTSSIPLDTNGILCTKVAESFEGTKYFKCPFPTYARYVKMRKTARTLFHACEFEVMVSKKRDDIESRRKVWNPKPFNIVRNSHLPNEVNIEDTNVDRALACVEMCDSHGDFCNGCLWTEQTGRCQVLEVDPYNVGQVVDKTGTDLYVKAPIKCIGDGVWTYV